MAAAISLGSMPFSRASVGRALGDLAELTQTGGRVGDERPAAVLDADQAEAFELRVDGPRRVDVDAREAGQLAHTGDAVAGQEHAAGKHRPDLPAELGADRDLGVALDLEVDVAGPLELLGRERKLRKRDRSIGWR